VQLTFRPPIWRPTAFVPVVSCPGPPSGSSSAHGPRLGILAQPLRSHAPVPSSAQALLGQWCPVQKKIPLLQQFTQEKSINAKFLT